MSRIFRFRRSSKTESTCTQDAEVDDLSEKGNQPGDSKDDDAQAAPWKALFFFTTKAHSTCLTIAVISALAAGGITPAQSYLLGKAFNAFTTFSGTELLKTVTKYVFWLLALGAGSWLVHFISFSSWLAFGELQANGARVRLFKGMLGKDLQWYDMRKNGVGAMIPRLQAQIRDLQLATAQPLGGFLTLIATALSSLGLALYTSWKLTLVIISTAPLITLIVGYLGSTMQKYVNQQQDKMAEALKYVASAINTIETVKCFNGQEHELRKYTSRLSEAAVWYYRIVNANAQQFGLTQFMASAMFVQGFYYGGVLVKAGENKTGDVVTTFYAAINAFQSISGILPQMIVLEKGRKAGATLRVAMAQMARSPTIPQPMRLTTPDQCEGNIDFKNVSFAYPARPDQMVLKDVTLSIPGRATTFIIGKSGSGKSTFGQLLMHFYPPALGEILFDGHPIGSLDPSWLRHRITLVEQNSTLFEDTVFQNIALGQEDHHRVSKEEVAQATEFALLQSMINDMPKGLDTMVGSKGGTMSGGQRQRMALARAFLRNTPVLLLDESTSALDQVSRSLMLDAIRKWRDGKTTMIITHDISQILPDDYAMIFEDGRLVQEGYRKDMEEMPGSPFYGFLTPNAVAASSPSDIPEQNSVNPMWRHRTDNVESQLPVPACIDDPLDAQLYASENSRYSYLPSLFANQHTKAAFKGAYGFAAPIGNLKSPVTNLMIGPPAPASDKGSPTSPVFGFDEMFRYRSKENIEKRKSNRKSYAPELLESFVEKTGTLAARARIASGYPRRRRLHSDASIGVPSDAIELKPSGKRVNKMKNTGEPTGNGIEIFSITTILKTVWPNLDWSTRIVLVVGFIAAALNAATTPVFSYVLSKLIATYGKGKQGKHLALTYSLAILGIAFVGAVTSYLMHILLEYSSQRWIDEMRAQSLERVLDQPRDFFSREENSVSHIMEGLDRHAEEMRNLLGRFASSVFIAFVLISVSLIWAMISQWKLTLIALALAPYIWFVTKSFGTVSGKWEGKSNDAAEAAGSIFTETFTNIKTVRALTLEKHFSEEYFEATTNALTVGFRRSLYTGFFYGLSDSSGIFVTALMFYVGAKLIKEGAAVGKIVEVFLQLIMTITSVSLVLAFIPQMSSSRDAASRLLRLAFLPKDSHEHEGNTQIASVGDIQLNDLSFSYPSRPTQTVLNNINLLIPAGESTAIVGSSGSGKSTIAALLLNLYTTSTGAPQVAERVPEITLSGRDFKHIHTATLRSLITVVSQTPVLFTATIAENISYGLPKSSPYNDMSSIRRAAAAAGIDEFVTKLPQGYETLVGEGGTGLSGGQAQRIAIARALIRRPAVMILDEATSALDVESANLVRNTIQTLVDRDGTGMTVIIITHSKDMMKIAKNIVMLSQGEIVEHGGYDQLLRLRGEFFRLLSGGEWAGEWADEPIRKDNVGVQGMSGTVDWNGSR